MVCISGINVIKYKGNSYEGESIPMAIKRRFPIRVATVYCTGGCRAKRDEKGIMLCRYGCVACGACMNACRFGAIGMNEYGVAEVDEEKCIGCGACENLCPSRPFSAIYVEGHEQHRNI